MTRLAGLAPLALLAALPAFAHAILIDSTPKPLAHVPAGHLAITLRYNSRIDASRSRLLLIAASGDRRTLPSEAGATPDLLTAAADIPPGEWRLRWQVLAVDGHITRGDVPFTADAGASPSKP